MRDENTLPAETGGGSESGQGSAAVGDPKKRLELVALKAAIEQVQGEYAFSERRTCRLITMAVTTYRYRSLRRDEPLRTQLVELAREKKRLCTDKGHLLGSCRDGLATKEVCLLRLSE